MTWAVRSGFSGTFPIASYGLAPARVTRGWVATGKKVRYPITVPDGTRVARFAAFGPPDASAADIDLVVYRQAGGSEVSVGQSVGMTAREAVTLVGPAPGKYVAEVQGYTPAPGTSTTAYSFRSYLVKDASGDLVASSGMDPVAAGDEVPITALFEGVDPSVPSFGWVQYADGSGTGIAVNSGE